MTNMGPLHNERVQKYIQLCVKDLPVLNHLLTRDVISNEKADTIKALYNSGTHIKATEMLLDILLRSTRQDCFQALVDAFIAAEYPFLASLLTDDKAVQFIKNDQGRIMMTQYRNELVKIEVEDVLPSLYSKGLINLRDREQVLAYLTSSGLQKAADELCDRVMTRKAPADWYCGFLEVLVNNKQDVIVAKIEPDFLKDKTGFKRFCETGHEIQPLKKQKISTPSCSGDTSIMETTAYCMSEAPMDDMCSPPPAKLDVDCIQDTCQSTVDSSDSEYPMNSLSSDCSPPSNTSKICNVSPNLNTVNIKPVYGEKDMPTSPTPTKDKDMDTDVKKKDVSDIENNVQDDNIKESNTDEEYDALDSDDDWLDYREESHLKLRDYQMELAEDALKGKNTIICAPTGCGKTWVAFYIVQQHLKKKCEGPAKVVFMARTGNLVKQQADRFKKYLPHAETKLISGEEEDSKRVGVYLEHYDIVCLTPQILINNLDSGSVSGLSAISMLVLDECHHTKKDEPYNNLMRRYLDEKSRKPSARLPQIIGMTASIGVDTSNTKDEACDYIVRICARLDSRVISTVRRHIKELEGNVVDTEEQMIKMQERMNNPCEGLILLAIEETENMLKDAGCMERALITQLCSIPRDKESLEYQKWTVELKKIAQQDIADAGKSRDIQSCAMYLYTYNAALEVNRLLETENVAQYFVEKLGIEESRRETLNNTETKLLGNIKDLMKAIFDLKCENPNVSVIVRILGSMLDQKGEECRAMVFVQQRATCRALAKFLDNALHSKGVRAGALYGKDVRGSEEGMTEAIQNENIEQFRSGQLKILVATSVGTEGIDIPDNNIALSYNYSGNEITKVQIKGRIRKSGGTSVIMGTQKLLEKERINAYKINLMHKGLSAFNDLDQRQIETKIKKYQDEELANYRMKKKRDELSQKNKQSAANSGIQLICRRCKAKACSLNDIRTVAGQYIIIDPCIKDRAEKRLHRTPKMYGGFHKKYKMFCKKCPLDWGIVSINKEINYYTVKLTSFMFLKDDGQLESFAKWQNVPYDIPEFSEGDLDRVFSEQ